MSTRQTELNQLWSSKY